MDLETFKNTMYTINIFSNHIAHCIITITLFLGISYLKASVSIVDRKFVRKFDFTGNHQIAYLVFHVVHQTMVRMEDQCMQLVNCYYVSIHLIL